jgi:prepilin-type N-terminal cleavage/methylation domain-containing protein
MLFKTKKHKGATLIELMISMTLLSVVSMCAISFFHSGKKQLVRAKIIYYATDLAENRIEYLRSSYSLIPNSFNETYHMYGTTFTLVQKSTEILNFVNKRETDYYAIVDTSVTWTVNGKIDGVFYSSIFAPENYGY